MIELTTGDTKPDLRFRLKEGNQPKVLPTGSQVNFRFRKPSGTIVTVPLALEDQGRAIWSGNFAVGDLDFSVDVPFLAELVILYPGGGQQHAEEPFEVFVRAEFQDSPG